MRDLSAYTDEQLIQGFATSARAASWMALSRRSQELIARRNLDRLARCEDAAITRELQRRIADQEVAA